MNALDGGCTIPETCQSDQNILPWPGSLKALKGCREICCTCLPVPESHDNYLYYSHKNTDNLSGVPLSIIPASAIRCYIKIRHQLQHAHMGKKKYGHILKYMSDTSQSMLNYIPNAKMYVQKILPYKNKCLLMFLSNTFEIEWECLSHALYCLEYLFKWICIPVF